jgi:hypothetical protein
MDLNRSRDSIGSTVTRVQAGPFGVWILAGARDFPRF